MSTPRIRELEREAAAVHKQRVALKNKAAELADAIAREYAALEASRPPNPIPPQAIG